MTTNLKNFREKIKPFRTPEDPHYIHIHIDDLILLIKELSEE